MKENNTNEGSQPTPMYQRYQDYNIDLYLSGHTPAENVLLRGRALLNKQKNEMSFVQSPPRGARSKEIQRTVHGRMVRRPDGNYTITFSALKGGERNLRESLLVEVRRFYSVIQKDIEEEEAKRRKEEKNAESEK